MPQSRASRYARAMAMPPLARWRPLKGLPQSRGRAGYELSFEGRDYTIQPVRYLSGQHYVLFFTPWRGGRGWLGADGRPRPRATVHCLYKTPTSAAAAARRFAAVEGYASTRSR